MNGEKPLIPQQTSYYLQLQETNQKTNCTISNGRWSTFYVTICVGIQETLVKQLRHNCSIKTRGIGWLKVFESSILYYLYTPKPTPNYKPKTTIII